jgi:hypothetical protein
MLKDVARFVLDRPLAELIKYINRRTTIDVYKILWARAAVASADYVEKQPTTALLFHSREHLWEHALMHVKADGLFVEFGVSSGSSNNTIAARLPDKRIFGFDSF